LWLAASSQSSASPEHHACLCDHLTDDQRFVLYELLPSLVYFASLESAFPTCWTPQEFVFFRDFPQSKKIPILGRKSASFGQFVRLYSFPGRKLRKRRGMFAEGEKDDGGLFEDPDNGKTKNSVQEPKVGTSKTCFFFFS
jgi:hypothetical protein